MICDCVIVFFRLFLLLFATAAFEFTTRDDFFTTFTTFTTLRLDLDNICIIIISAFVRSLLI
jgi:hypothetical protein